MKNKLYGLDELLERVDCDRLMASVREITKEVRLAATPSEAKTICYLNDYLRALGLEVKLFYEKAYISLPQESSLSVGGEEFACTTHSMLPSANVSAEVIYIATENLRAETSAQIEGKIVLTEGLATSFALRSAQEKGAAGVIFITGEYIHEMIVSDVWGSPTPPDQDLYLVTPAVSVNRADGSRLKSLLREKKERAVMNCTVENAWVDLPILTADLKSENSPDYLLLSGHVDSWHYGAMDNASGNAAALEIATLMKTVQDKLQRGIKFVFWSGHSQGRYAGSTAFCDAHFSDLLAHCFLHINVDCLGGADATILTQAACMAETKALGAAAIHKVTGECLEGVRFGRSCDQSFWGTGTPSLFSGVSEQAPPLQADAAAKAFSLLFGSAKSGGFGWWWHTSADTIERLDPANLKRDSQIFLAAVYMASVEKLIPFVLSDAVAEIKEVIKRYAIKTEAMLDFSETLQLLMRLECAVAEIEARKKRYDTVLRIRDYNAFTLNLEQILVPLNYVKGSIYDHDTTVRRPPIPLLEEIDDLAALEDTHAWQALLIFLQRRCNQVQHQIKRALVLAEEFLTAPLR